MGVPAHVLRRIGMSISEAIDAGIRGEPGAKLACIPSHITKLPTGAETGTFFALDLGGTNLRVAMVRLGEGHGVIEEQVVEESTVPARLLAGPAAALFAFLAERLGEMVSARWRGEGPARVGFSFSFPMRQTGCRDGQLMYWTKGYACEGAVGQSVVPLLQRALEEAGVPATVDVILNDALGPLLSSQYCGGGTRVAAIFGTGTNMSYVEDARRVPGVPPGAGPGMLVNSEWSNWWDASVMAAAELDEDADLDAASLNPGRGRYEKLVSGLHLGEVARRLLRRLWAAADLGAPGGLATGGSLPTATVGAIADDSSKGLLAVRDALRDALGLHPPAWVLRPVQRVCRLVLARAGRMAGVGLAAALDYAGALEAGGRVTVGVDGSLFRNSRPFRDGVTGALEDVLPGLGARVHFHTCDASSVIGAALAAAVCGPVEAGSPAPPPGGKSAVGQKIRGSREALRQLSFGHVDGPGGGRGAAGPMENVVIEGQIRTVSITSSSPGTSHGASYHGAVRVGSVHGPGDGGLALRGLRSLSTTPKGGGAAPRFFVAGGGNPGTAVPLAATQFGTPTSDHWPLGSPAGSPKR